MLARLPQSKSLMPISLFYVDSHEPERVMELRELL